VNKKIVKVGFGVLVTHGIIWFGLLSFMIILWKVFELGTYLLWERIALILSVIVGIITYIWEELNDEI